MRVGAPVSDYIRKSILTTQGDLAIQGAVDTERIAAGLLDTYFKGQGVGNLPIYEKMSLKDTGVHIGNFPRDTSGNEVVTGVGFQPSVVFFFAVNIDPGTRNESFGFDDGTNQMCLAIYNDGIYSGRWITRSILVNTNAANNIIGIITAMGSDGFTVTFTLTGTQSIYVIYLALP